MAESDTPVPRGRGWSHAERIIVTAAVLLAADLVLLPWHRFSLSLPTEQFGVEVPSFRIDRTGVQEPYALFGIAASVIAVGMVIHLLMARRTSAVPRPGPTTLIAGALVLGLVAAKLLANTDFLAIGAWAGLALAAAVAYGGFALSQDASTGSDTAVGGA